MIPGIICQMCGKPTPKRGPGSQKYCVPCSEIADLRRKSTWAKRHPLSSVQIQRRSARQRARLKLQGATRGLMVKSSITWDQDRALDLVWVVRVGVPFDYAYSKNAIYSLRPQGHVFLRKASRQMRDMLILAIREAGGHQRAVPGKVWLDILVQKPNHKGDATNVLDTVCDAVKEAIGVDDRWFAIRRLDWEIVKQDPQLYVGIGQETTVPHRVCSYCGRVLELSSFPKRKDSSLGYGRVCHECARLDEQTRRPR